MAQNRPFEVLMLTASSEEDAVIGAVAAGATGSVVLPGRESGYQMAR